MRFLRNNGGVISLPEPTLGELLSYRQLETGTPESGGMLLGRLIEGSDDVVIDRISVPAADDRRSRFSFFRQKRSAQKLVDAAWSDSSGTCIYLGEWHTHPEDVPNPSSNVDVPNWRQIVKTAVYEQDFLLFAIVGRVDTRIWELLNPYDEPTLTPRLEEYE